MSGAPRAIERALLLAPRWPLPAHRGYERRTLELLRELRHHCEVRLVCFGDGPPLGFDGAPARSVDRSAVGTVVANVLADPLLPVQSRLYLDRAMRDAVAEDVRTFRPDVVVAMMARMAPYLNVPGDFHRHVEFIDALSLNMARRAAAERVPLRTLFTLEGKLMARYEAKVMAAADSASLVADGDLAGAPWLRDCAIIPAGVHLGDMPYRTPADRPPVLVFFGNLGYFPNIRPAEVVAREILPLVRREVPEATLRIVGARPAAAVRALDTLEGVTVVGPVDEMATELYGAAVAVVPVYTGSGMKTKITEAMATGTPVVANAMALDGIVGAQPGVDHLLGETPQELADATVRLLRDPEARERQARAARALVEERFTWAARARALFELWTR